MDNITVLITGAGVPRTKGALYSLKNNFDGREIRTYSSLIGNETLIDYIIRKKVKTINSYSYVLIRVKGIIHLERHDGFIKREGKDGKGNRHC